MESVGWNHPWWNHWKSHPQVPRVDSKQYLCHVYGSQRWFIPHFLMFLTPSLRLLFTLCFISVFTRIHLFSVRLKTKVSRRYDSRSGQIPVHWHHIHLPNLGWTLQTHTLLVVGLTYQLQLIHPGRGLTYQKLIGSQDTTFFYKWILKLIHSGHLGNVEVRELFDVLHSPRQRVHDKCHLRNSRVSI